METTTIVKMNPLPNMYLLMDIVIHSQQSAYRSYYILSLLNKRMSAFLKEHFDSYFISRAPRMETNYLYDSLNLNRRACKLQEQLERVNYIGCVNENNSQDQTKVVDYYVK